MPGTDDKTVIEMTIDELKAYITEHPERNILVEVDDGKESERSQDKTDKHMAA